MIAQLMRIHVVTPKAPVHCLMLPKVLPAPMPCPIFFPEEQQPIKLTTSSYWVLRLPYCYVGNQVYGPPTDPDNVSLSTAKIFKDVLTVKSMSPGETKIWEKENL